MRKVIYNEWVSGIITKEWHAWYMANTQGEPEPRHYVEGTNRNTEKEGFFHGFFPRTIEGAEGAIGNYTVAIVETKDGTIKLFDPENIRFIDKPENEQRTEFAKAAMQGLLSNIDVTQSLDIDREWIVFSSVSHANALIAELKKQKQ